MKPNLITNCQSKKFYETKTEAENTATYLFHQKGLDLEVYFCQWCSFWHLTKIRK